MGYFMTCFRIVSFVAILASTAASAQFTAYMGMQDQRIPGYDSWQGLQMQEGHWGRGAEQPAYQWTNVTFEIPYGATGVQVTAVDSNGQIMTQGGHSADIPFYSVNRMRSKLQVSFVWWGAPWTVFVGWGAPRTDL